MFIYLPGSEIFFYDDGWIFKGHLGDVFEENGDVPWLIELSKNILKVLVVSDVLLFSMTFHHMHID